MIAIVVWLLPEPDSPTIATVSFGMTSRSIPLTAEHRAVVGLEVDASGRGR